MINIFRFIKLSWEDIKNRKNNKNISGIWVYVGDFGQGKTLSLVKEALKLNGQGYNIYTNFGLSFADGYLKHWQDILQVPENSVICIDEVGETFNSRAWHSMPKQVFGHMIQNRKRNIRFLFTAQEFDDVDKCIRGKTKYVIECKKYLRLVVNKFYNRKVYYYKSKRKQVDFKESFLLEESLASLYDTNEFVQILGGID